MSMSNRCRPLSDAEREQRRAEQRELVKASIEQLRSSEGWQAYVKARRRLHQYSLRNLLLIVLQHETAEYVAGFQAWLKLGYCVRKGEHAIKIWAPCPPNNQQLKACREAGADPDTRPRTRWRLASVFAQDQVDPLPPLAVPAPLTAPGAEISGDSHEQLIDRLIALADEVGYRVAVCDTGAADGRCNHLTKTITLADRLEPNGRLSVLIHELAHALVALELGDRRVATYDYAQEELIVESVAFCCAQTIGLDTTASSIPYLASWAERASPEVLEQSAQLTGKLADRIEAALQADGPDQGDAAGTGTPVPETPLIAAAA